MQLRAFDEQDQLIFAHHATKQKNYFCIECGNIVRMRSGLHRQAHYYHVQPNPSCRLNGKSLIHLMVQQHLKNLLHEQEVELEHRFPSIGRIADVAWISKQLIFEIQCSPISAQEISERNHHYASIGYQTIWILHEQRFHQKKLSAAENFLQKHTHYFTNIDEEGRGQIYDSFSVIETNHRIHQLPKIKIDPTTPQQYSEDLIDRTAPHFLLKRQKSWSMGFSGDYFDRYNKGELHFDDTTIQLLESRESNFLSQPLGTAIKQLFHRFIAVPYRSLLRLLLERACR